MTRNKMQAFALISALCIGSNILGSAIPAYAVEMDGVNMIAQVQDKGITVPKDLVMCGASDFVSIRLTATTNGKVCGKLRVGDTGKILENDKDSDWYKIESGEVVGYALKKYCITGDDLKEYLEKNKKDLKFEITNKSFSPVGVYDSEFSSTSDSLICSTTGVAKKKTYIYLSKEKKSSQDETQPTDVYKAQSEDGFTSFYGEADEESIRHRLIPNDTELDILEQGEEWTKISYDGLEGYVKTIQVIHSVEEIPLSNIGATLKKDKKVKVYDIDDKGWATVECKGAIGYMKAKDLKLTYTPTSDSIAQSVLGYGDSLEINDWFGNFAHIKNEDESQSCVDLTNCNISVVENDAEVVKYKTTSKKSIDLSKLKDNETTKKRTKIANYALKFVGNPYVWGGTSLTNGADCSGFCQSVLKHFDISIPRVACDQATAGKEVKPEDIRVGDLVFYADSSGYINHVGMYIGNGEIVNASSPSTGIKVSKIGYRNVVAIRNVID